MKQSRGDDKKNHRCVKGKRTRPADFHDNPFGMLFLCPKNYNLQYSDIKREEKINLRDERG
jgi:hypothetical protein